MQFLLVPGDRQPLLGMSDNKILGILPTIESQEADTLENCKANMRQEIKTMKKHYTNTDGSKFEIKNKLMVNDNSNNSMKYFLPGPNYDGDKKGN